MSELFYSNLPHVYAPDTVKILAKHNLVDFENYLNRAKKQIESAVPLATWEMEGEYHSLSSTSKSPDDIRKVLADKDEYELRFVNEEGELVQLDVRYIYVQEQVIILDIPCEFKTAKITHYDVHDKPTVYELSVDHIPSGSIGTNVQLPHYRLLLDSFDDTESASKNLDKFFDDYTSKVSIAPKSLIDNARHKKKRHHRSSISKIEHQDFKSRCIHITTIPGKNTILKLQPNTKGIDPQLSAIKRLKNSPLEGHRPLVRLFENRWHAKWPSFNLEDVSIDEFRFLQDGFSGVDSQRDFVRRALATPDFALLEGPPGSGKTAVITEIIMQAIERGERVLLSASTHVAVDNVIERLKDEKNPLKNEILLVRIGDKSRVSRKSAEYTLENFVETELRALRGSLKKIKNLTDWQITLRDTLEKSQTDAEGLIRRLILNSAQIICGTTIGILQHPEIKEIKEDDRPVDPSFDMLILDEASKTTFSEFVVPALHARKWIIVGDCRQLSPFVDDREIEVNVAAAFDLMMKDDIGSKSGWRERCFKIHEGLMLAHSASVIIQIADEDDRQRVVKQASDAAVLAREHLDKGIDSSDLVCDLSKYNFEVEESRLLLSCSAVVIGTQQEITEYERFLPYHCIHMDGDELKILLARSKAVESSSQSLLDPNKSWEKEITWRMKRYYEKKLFSLEHKSDANELPATIDSLLPSKHLKKDEENSYPDLLNVFKIGFPSILESLQFGFGRGSSLRSGTKTAITHGLPKESLECRHGALEFQHRMHPSISKYPRDSIYEGKLLLDAEDILSKRSQFPDEQRVIWIDVPDGEEAGKSKSNRREADAVITRIKHLRQSLSNYPHPEGSSWTVAVLTFYRGQERELKSRLRELTKQNRSPYKFGPLSIELCTTDRFQGHEADIVILSYVRTRFVGFLDSPNRINVAITRARYQMIHVGKRKFFEKEKIRNKARLICDLIRGLPQEAFGTDTGKKRRKRS
jgi:hypothetical protein